LDELLARGTLGGRHYDEIFEKVVARTGSAGNPPGRRWFRWFLASGAVLAPAVAAWIVIAGPRAGHPTPKGEPGIAAALQIGCGPSGAAVCHVGDTLMFSVNAAVVSGYLGAYAERIGDSTRGRVWYYPTSTGHSPAVAPGEGTAVLPDGVRIGAEHPPGRYRVRLWLAERPLARNEIDAADSGRLRADRAIEVEVLP
jgi:hypothetical protein